MVTSSAKIQMHTREQPSDFIWSNQIFFSTKFSAAKAAFQDLRAGYAECLATLEARCTSICGAAMPLSRQLSRRLGLQNSRIILV